MENLKNALHNRLSGRAAKAIMFEVASVIDEAASKIERL
jgi:hypothetical protein